MMCTFPADMMKDEYSRIPSGIEEIAFHRREMRPGGESEIALNRCLPSFSGGRALILQTDDDASIPAPSSINCPGKLSEIEFSFHHCVHLYQVQSKLGLLVKVFSVYTP